MDFGHHAVTVADVGDDVLEPRPQVERGEEVRLGWRVERIAGDFGAKSREPLGEPRAFEPRMAGDEYPSSAKAVAEGGHSVLPGPDRPRRFSGGPQCLKRANVPQGIHGLPEAAVAISA